MRIRKTWTRPQYATNGVTTAFTIHFPFFNDTDVNAIFVDASGNATVLALNADFTVSGGGGAGGSLVATLAPANGGTLTVFRQIPFTQEDDYVEDDPLPADTLEGGFDRAVMRDQQLKDAQDRALTFPVTIDTGVSAVLPLPAADRVLGWNTTADALENKNLPAGTAVYASTANTNLGASTGEAVTPKALHDSIYNTDDTTVAVTGETTAVAAGTAKATFRQPRKITLTAVRAALKTAQASGSILTIDVNVNGATILSTRLTVDNTERTSVTAAIPPVIGAAVINADDEITIDVDQVGDGTAAGLKVQFLGRIEP
jgi:hypothetical protein